MFKANHVHQAPVCQPQLRNDRQGKESQDHKGTEFFRYAQFLYPELQLADLGIYNHRIPVAHQSGNGQRHSRPHFPFADDDQTAADFPKPVHSHHHILIVGAYYR